MSSPTNNEGPSLNELLGENSPNSSQSRSIIPTGPTLPKEGALVWTSPSVPGGGQLLHTKLSASLIIATKQGESVPVKFIKVPDITRVAMSSANSILIEQKSGTNILLVCNEGPHESSQWLQCIQLAKNGGGSVQQPQQQQQQGGEQKPEHSPVWDHDFRNANQQQQQQQQGRQQQGQGQQHLPQDLSATAIMDQPNPNQQQQPQGGQQQGQGQQQQQQAGASGLVQTPSSPQGSTAGSPPAGFQQSSSSSQQIPQQGQGQGQPSQQQQPEHSPVWDHDFRHPQNSQQQQGQGQPQQQQQGQGQGQQQMNSHNQQSPVWSKFPHYHPPTNQQGQQQQQQQQTPNQGQGQQTGPKPNPLNQADLDMDTLGTPAGLNAANTPHATAGAGGGSQGGMQSGGGTGGNSIPGTEPEAGSPVSPSAWNKPPGTPAAGGGGNNNNKPGEEEPELPLPEPFVDVDGLTAELMQEQRHPMLLMAFIALLAFACSFAQTASTAYTYSQVSSGGGIATMDVTLWNADFCVSTSTQSSSCASSGLPFSEWCSALDSRWRAMQAFSILVVLYSTATLFFAYCAVDVERMKPFVWKGIGRFARPLNFLNYLVFGNWIFWMILWTLVAGTFHVAPCASSASVDLRDRMLQTVSLVSSGFKLSVTFSLSFVMWVYWLAWMIWSYYRRGFKDQGVYGNELDQPPSPAAGNNNASATSQHGQQQQQFSPAQSGGASANAAASAAAGGGYSQPQHQQQQHSHVWDHFRHQNQQPEQSQLQQQQQQIQNQPLAAASPSNNNDNAPPPIPLQHQQHSPGGQSGNFDLNDLDNQSPNKQQQGNSNVNVDDLLS